MRLLRTTAAILWSHRWRLLLVSYGTYLPLTLLIRGLAKLIPPPQTRPFVMTNIFLPIPRTIAPYEALWVLCFQPVIMAAITGVAVAALQPRAAEADEAPRIPLGLLLPFIGASLLPGLAELLLGFIFSLSFVGLMLCFGIPVLLAYGALYYLYAHIALAPTIVIAERLGPWQALRQSWARVHPSLRRVVLFLLALQLAQWVLASWPLIVLQLLPAAMIHDYTTLNGVLRWYEVLLAPILMTLASVGRAVLAGSCASN